jgi:hypothetical protein
MNTTNIILVGFSLGLFDYIKNTGKIISEKISDPFSLENFLLGAFNSGELTENTTLVFDVHNQKDSEIQQFLEKIMPVANELFKNKWNIFSKKIVVLLSETSTLNPVLNSLGINGFSRKKDVQDYMLQQNL